LQEVETVSTPLAAIIQTVISSGGLAAAIGMITGSAAILFSFIGFSEILGFLPMINLDYNPGL
jgi:hypothetical protein